MRQDITKIVASIILLLIVMGCTEKNDGTYLRFTVEGKEYRVDGVQLSYLQLPQQPNHYRFMLVQNPHRGAYQETSGGSIHWIMELGSIEELQGKEIDFSKNQNEANVGFTLEKKDITVGTCVTPVDKEIVNDMVIKIERVDEKYIEGSFSASNYCCLSVTDKVVRPVSITGSFRAKLERLKNK